MAKGRNKDEVGDLQAAAGTDGGDAPPPANGDDGSAAANTMPQFAFEELGVIGIALALVVLVAILMVMEAPDWTAEQTNVKTTTITNSDGTSVEVVTARDFPFAAQMARLLALGGLGVIALGAWLQAAAMRKAVVRTELPQAEILGGRALPGFEKVVTAVGEAFSKLKPPVALVVAGLLMLLAAGWIAVETLPVRSAPAGTTSDAESESESSATPDPTATSTPTGGPATGDEPLPTSTPTG
ncbi:hypothetical protein [Salsipaludibacter albus]|uniref:hypothetical protein n=1 Tax=Salsipaludibacter albus TaxID=2849650 RepID=UPI001EE465DD|nr:hypothetical protein [Salsipaludibacter albus]MBY5163113.1 hypothetical protein [Salsipaludibacter albus]